MILKQLIQSMMDTDSEVGLRRWAVFFNAVGLTYEYEIEGFEMDGTRYLPDFYIPSLNRWFEIKGQSLDLPQSDVDLLISKLIDSKQLQ